MYYPCLFVGRPGGCLLLGFGCFFFNLSDLFMHYRGVKSCLGIYKAQGVEDERNQ